MTIERLRGRTRILIGRTISESPATELDDFLIDALDLLAVELGYSVRQNDTVGLVAGQQEYPLGASLQYLLWVSWNDTRLEPVSVSALNRDQTNYQTAYPAGTPAQFAVQGQKLILLPAASSDAITTDPFLAWRYVATGPQEMGPAALADLTDSDLLIVQYEAAAAYLVVYGGEGAAPKIADYRAQAARRMPAAKRRRETPSYHERMQFQPVIDRLGGAR